MSGLPEIITDVPGPRSRELADRLRGAESPNITYIAPDFPIFWDEAHGCIVKDVDGNSFLDMTAAFGVAAVGHGHPEVVAAVRDQAARLMHGMGDVHPSAPKVALCERIAGAVPIDNARVILGLNGGDAVEAALKTAMLATGKPGVLAFEGGYHGLTYGALDATARHDFREPFLPQMGRFTTHLPFGCDLDVADACLRQGGIGAVLTEPIQGRGGIVEPPAGWLPGLRALCDRHGVLLILDEIFTGWGRTGDLFACQHEGIRPDVLCLGKAMGGGMPVSACVASAQVMAAWGESSGEALHTSTFLGHPVSCAAALAAIHVIERDRLTEQARVTGAVLKDGLRTLVKQHPTLLDGVRGRGLMLGLECRTPEIGLSLVPRALRHGLIVLPAGDGRVIELVPPLVLAPEEARWSLAALNTLLTD